MEGTLDCRGQISLGSLPWEVSEHLAQFRGNWLEFAPGAKELVFRRVQPHGCPPLTGVACELITILDSLPQECRESMPGGELSLGDARGPLLRLAVRRGQVQVKWPHRPCMQAISFPLESVAGRTETPMTAVTGWARLSAAPAKRKDLEAFVERFGGLYPEEDMPSECAQDVAFVRFTKAVIDPQALVESLRALAEPPDSLQADLVTGAGSGTRFAIRIIDGCVHAERSAQT